MTREADGDGDADLARILQYLGNADRIAVLTGAGMSAESGIPVFRGPRNGLWEQFDPEALATAEAFRADPALVWGWYRWRSALVGQAEPNAGHRALAALERLRPQLRIITQNVDDLHERAGSRVVIHLHGSLFALRCFACGRPHPRTVEPEGGPAADTARRAADLRGLRGANPSGRRMVR